MGTWGGEGSPCGGVEPWFCFTEGLGFCSVGAFRLVPPVPLSWCPGRGGPWTPAHAPVCSALCSLIGFSWIIPCELFVVCGRSLSLRSSWMDSAGFHILSRVLKLGWPCREERCGGGALWGNRGSRPLLNCHPSMGTEPA